MSILTVQFEYALNKNNYPVHINDIITGEKYICLDCDCKSEMIPKRGNIRAYHFAHKNIGFDHKGESALHYNTKYLLGMYLQRCVSDGLSFNIEYISRRGSYMGSIDIVSDIQDVYIEKHIAPEYRPDIAAYDSNGEVSFAIEIINTHDLSYVASNYVFNNKIPLIKVYITEVLYSYLKEQLLDYPDTFSIWSTDMQYNISNFQVLAHYEVEDVKFRSEYSEYLKKINNLQNTHASVSQDYSALVRRHEKLINENIQIQNKIDKLNQNIYDIEIKITTQKDNFIIGEKTKKELSNRIELNKKCIEVNRELELKPIVCDVHSGGIICYFKKCNECPALLAFNSQGVVNK